MEEYLITKELCESCVYCQRRNENNKMSCGFAYIEGESRIWRCGKRKSKPGYCCEYIKRDPSMELQKQIENIRKRKIEANAIFGGK